MALATGLPAGPRIYGALCLGGLLIAAYGAFGWYRFSTLGQIATATVQTFDTRCHPGRRGNDACTSRMSYTFKDLSGHMQQGSYVIPRDKLESTAVGGQLTVKYLRDIPAENEPAWDQEVGTVVYALIASLFFASLGRAARLSKAQQPNSNSAGSQPLSVRFWPAFGRSLIRQTAHPYSLLLAARELAHALIAYVRVFIGPLKHHR